MMSPEFRLAVACARASFANDGSREIPEIAARVDWPRFVRVVRFHRIQGLVWKSLVTNEAGAPAEVTEALSSNARAIVATNLSIAQECREVLQAFQHANVLLLFVKGLTVAALAHRSPMLKMASDIDLLIDTHDLAAAAELLGRRGYTLRLPSRPAQLQAWHARSKESVWSRDGCIHIELHTRLADNRQLIPEINVRSPRQMVEVAPGIELPTLGPEELFAYLCVHGASSAWFRLKWIADLAGWLSRHDPAEIERLYHRSQQLGAGRTAAQALLVADDLFRSLRCSGLRGALMRDRVNRLLAAFALSQAAQETEPTSRRFGTWRIHLNQLAMGGSLGFALADLSRQVGDALILRRFGSLQ